MRERAWRAFDRLCEIDAIWLVRVLLGVWAVLVLCAILALPGCRPVERAIFGPADFPGSIGGRAKTDLAGER